MSDRPISEVAAKGGRARAKKLSAEERAGIARSAAESRWEAEREAGRVERILRATHAGELHIGGKAIPCAVLEDGTRVLTQVGFMEAVGRSGKPPAGKGSSFERIAPFFAPESLKPYISNDLRRSTTPIQFKTVQGRRAWGYRAELLPQVCEVYLKARDEGKLSKDQERFARACDALVRGLANVGIVALVDEASGYQDVRDRLALQAILDRFLQKELAAWAKRFPDEFYQEMFRLRGWAWKDVSSKRPVAVGKYTNDLVYDRLAPGLLAELENRNPRDEKGHRRAKHHQRLTEDVGHPALAQHLYAVIGFMRASESWQGFYNLLQRAYPKKNTTMLLPGI
jgi:hypothetical protein